MENEVWKLICAALALGIGIILWRRKKAAMDAQAMFWASVAEPLFFISRHAFDEDVVMLAAEAKANLVKHGNRWLDPETDVFVWVYGSDVSNPSRNFSHFQELAFLQASKTLEAFRVQKAAHSQKAAHAAFSNQQIPNNDAARSN